METASSLAQTVGVAPACQALGVARTSFYRWRRPPSFIDGTSPVPVPNPTPTPATVTPQRTSPRALLPEERAAVLQQLHAPRFVNAAPAEVYATVLDEGVYLASERTMYRILAQQRESGDPRNQLTHPAYAKPELLATGPNQASP